LCIVQSPIEISYSSFENNGGDGINLSSADLPINNCQINNNGNHGIYASSGELQINNSQFNNNGNYAAHLSNVDVNTYVNNSASGNFIDAIGISGTASKDVTIGESVNGFPFVVFGPLIVSDGYKLTIQAGDIIKFNSPGKLTIYGTLDANGSETNPIVFTSLKDDLYGGDLNNDGTTTSPAPADWEGIYLNGYLGNDGIGEFDYCRIRYSGNYSGSEDANVSFSYSDSGHFLNSTSEYSAQDGLWANICSIEISNSSFDNNGNHGIYAGFGEFQINNNQFNNNGNYAAYLQGIDFKTFTNNSGSGNFIEAFGISGTAIEDITFSENLNGFPFVVIGLLSVSDDHTFTIPEGEVLKFTGF